MTLVAALGRAALRLVTSDPRYAHHTSMDLHRYVLGTGYADSARPYADTRDLLYTYAANLRNAGGAGVNLHRFGDMVTGALAFAISGNRVAPLHLPDLARRCLDWLDSPHGRPLVRGDDGRYREQLLALSQGAWPQYPLQRLLGSVVGFIDLLDGAYGGSAEVYHQSFSTPEARCEPGLAVVRRVTELMHLSGIGVATGMNFIKDSQMPRFATAALADVASEPLTWFVKPDMHVLRMVLFISGRFGQTGLAAHQLAHLPFEDAKTHYAGLAPARDWFPALTGRPLHWGRPRGETGLWSCVADVHAWAVAEEVPPILIDRLCYLIGSGRYTEGARLSVSQARRYAILIEKVEAELGARA